MSSNGALTYRNLASELATAVPKLAPSIEAELAAHADSPVPPQHLIFMLAFMPRLMGLLDGPDPETELPEMFEFVERMSTSRDEAVRNVAVTVVLEEVLGNGSRRANSVAMSHMGVATADFYVQLKRSGMFRDRK